MNMVMTKILIALFSFLGVLLFTNAILAVYNISTYYKQRFKLEKYKISVELDLSRENKNVLDEIIAECFREYILLNVEFKKCTITAEMEQDITKAVCATVVDTISETMLNKIGLFYNVNNLNSIIANKVYLLTMDYSISKNSPE